MTFVQPSPWSAISEQNELKIKQLNLVQDRQFQKFRGRNEIGAF